MTDLLDLQSRRGHQVVARELLDNVGMPDHVGRHHDVLTEGEHRVHVGLADVRVTVVGVTPSLPRLRVNSETIST